MLVTWERKFKINQSDTAGSMEVLVTNVSARKEKFEENTPTITIPSPLPILPPYEPPLELLTAFKESIAVSSSPVQRRLVHEPK